MTSRGLEGRFEENMVVRPFCCRTPVKKCPKLHCRNAASKVYLFSDIQVQLQGVSTLNSNQLWRSTMTGCPRWYTAAFTLMRLRFSSTRAPWASCMCPKTCSRQRSIEESAMRSARRRQPACLCLLVLSQMRYGGPCVRRISVVDGIFS